MADSKMLPIGPDFHMDETVKKIVEMYRAKGFDVTPVQLGSSVSIKFSKDEDGVKKFIGLGLEITANFSLSENMLMISFSDAEWTGKIIGLAVGWFFCLIPMFIAGYGCAKQSELPKTIANDVQMLLAGGTIPFGK